MALKHIKYGIWFPWTVLSETIPYKSTRNSVGKGEEKVAAEFYTTVQGQNSSYDLPPNCIPGLSKGVEIKQLLKKQNKPVYGTKKVMCERLLK